MENTVLNNETFSLMRLWNGKKRSQYWDYEMENTVVVNAVLINDTMMTLWNENHCSH